MSAAGNARMQVAIIPGGRLHLNDGPIDLVIAARTAKPGAGPPPCRRDPQICDRARRTLRELPLLRSPVAPMRRFAGMFGRATDGHCGAARVHDRFITRMAAVAARGRRRDRGDDDGRGGWRLASITAISLCISPRPGLSSASLTGPTPQPCSETRALAGKITCVESPPAAGAAQLFSGHRRYGDRSGARRRVG